MPCSPGDWHCGMFAGYCLLLSRMRWKCQPGEDATQCRRWTLPWVKSSWWDILKKLWVLSWCRPCVESLGTLCQAALSPLCWFQEKEMSADFLHSPLFSVVLVCHTHTHTPLPWHQLELGRPASHESGDLSHPVTWETRHSFACLWYRP